METIKASIQCFNYKLYSAEDLAKMLKCNTETMRRYIRGGKIKAQKIGRQYFVSEDNLKAFVNGETPTRKK